MATGNHGWGYTRICGALYSLGHEIGRNTVKRVLLDSGFDPAPLGSKGMSWRPFLKAHWGAIAVTDFFSVEVLTHSGLVRYLSQYGAKTQLPCYQRNLSGLKDLSLPYPTSRFSLSSVL